MEYAPDKHKLCLRSPVPLPEADVFNMLLRGLWNPIHVAALTSPLPASFTMFFTGCEIWNNLVNDSGTNWSSAYANHTHDTNTSPGDSPTATPPIPEFASVFLNLGDRLVNQIASSLSHLTVNFTASGPSGVGMVPRRGPPKRTCYACNRHGNITRDLKKKNDAAAQRGQWRI